MHATDEFFRPDERHDVDPDASATVYDHVDSYRVIFTQYHGTWSASSPDMPGSSPAARRAMKPNNASAKPSPSISRVWREILPGARARQGRSRAGCRLRDHVAPGYRGTAAFRDRVGQRLVDDRHQGMHRGRRGERGGGLPAGSNRQLQIVGHSYGVWKATGDHVYWSDDGN
jgi:hypothetical protein